MMKRIIILLGMLLSFYARGENLLLSQNLSNNLWSMTVMSDSGAVSNTMKEAISKKKLCLEALGGFAGGIIGTLPGAFIILAGSDGSFTFDIVGALVGLNGAIICTPIGVTFAGKKSGDKGSYWKSLLGTLIGATAGILVGGVTMYTIDRINYNQGVYDPATSTDAAALLIVSSTLLGAVWGYHK